MREPQPLRMPYRRDDVRGQQTTACGLGYGQGVRRRERREMRDMRLGDRKYAWAPRVDGSDRYRQRGENNPTSPAAIATSVTPDFRREYRVPMASGRSPYALTSVAHNRPCPALCARSNPPQPPPRTSKPPSISVTALRHACGEECVAIGWCAEPSRR